MKRFMAIVVLLLAVNVHAETKTGTTWTDEKRSAEGLNKVIEDWKFEMYNVAPSRRRTIPGTEHAYGGPISVQRTTYGCLFWCIDRNNRTKILYAFTYGEVDRDRAYNKANMAIGSVGTCYAQPTFYELSSTDLPR